MKQDLIRGAGGGGGGKGGGGGSARTPVETADSLRSKQFARVLDLVSEGEIVGLVNGLKSIYLDDTPLQNADDSYNFNNVSVQTRVGTQSQGYVSGFPSVESESAVGVEVKNSASVTRSVSNPNNTAARITLSVPQLTYQNISTGDLGGDSVQIAIDLQTAGGGYVQVISDTISGKTTTTYQRDYRIELSGAGPWDIRVRRITADSVESNRVNKVYWASYTEIIDHQLRYPNSALVGLQIDAAQFRTIPRRGYHLQGIKVRVPINYDPVTRTYTGSWDGTFKIAYTNNPAWCFYDLLTADRYGLGEFIDASQIDKWSLYTIGQYCDALVDDGFGGTEPRFSCNVYLQQPEEAYTVLQNMASIFRGMVYESGGFVTAVQDAPSDAAMIFTPANAVDGLFNYSGSSIKTRHTVALVIWNDPADRYRQKIEYVEDAEGIGRYGVRETQLVAIGCTSRGQAHRAGKWLLFTERLETETVSWRTGLDSAFVRPGEVVKIADPNVAGARLGGRIVAATTTSVTIDDTVTITTGHTYDLSVVLTDGTVATRTLNNAAGSATVLTFATPLDSAPAVQSVWVLADIGQVEPQTFRVLSVAEVEKNIYELVAISHNPGKYAAIEQGVLLETPPISAIDYSVQQPVASVTITKNTEKRQDGTLKVTALVAWPAAINATAYKVELKRDNDNWMTVDGNTSALIAIAEIAQEGGYTARITAFNAIGTPSVATLSAATQLYWVTLSPPSNLALAAAWVGPDVSVKWDPVDGAASYTVEVWASATLRRTVTGLSSPAYTYPFALNKADGGPWSELDFKVKSVGVSSESALVTLSVSNPQHGAPTGLAVVAGTTSVAVTVNKSSETDLAAFMFHMSTTTGFTPGPGNLVYEGPNNWFNAIGLTAGTPYYFKVTAYDLFDQVGMSYTAEISATPGGAGGVLSVGTEPTTTYLGQDVVFYTVNAKLYRWNGSAYTKAADGGDLLAASVTADKVSVANLSALSASMGSLTSGNFTVDAAGFIRGGQTAYNTGSGFWQGYDAGAYKFSIGNGSSYLAFDGTNLNISTPQFSIISGLATLGSISANGSISVGTTGNVRGGQSAYDTGSGFFLGYSGGAYKFSLGNSGGNKLTWDGSTLSVTGAIISTANLQPNSVSNRVASYNEGLQSFNITPLVLRSAVITTTGGTVDISVSAYNASAGSAYRLYRDSTLLATLPGNPSSYWFGAGNMFNFNFRDSPAAGTYTYKLEGYSPPNFTVNTYNQSIVLIEMKR